MARRPGTVPGLAPPWSPGLVGTVVAGVLGACWALTTPLMGLSDEPAHAVHAAAVVRGEVVGRDAVVTDPVSGWVRTETAVQVPAAYADLPALPTCFAFAPEVPATCAPPVDDAAGDASAAVTTVGTYDPVWYAAVGWPSLVLPPRVALVTMRLVAALLAATLAGVAVTATLRAGARRWGVVAVVVALPPVAMHLAGGVNPSGTEIAGAVALWATSAAVVSGAHARGDVIRWAVAAMVVAVARPLGPVFVLGIPVATWLALGPAAMPRGPDVRRAVATVAVVATGALGWTLWRGTLDAFSGFPDPDATGLTAVRASLGLVPERLVEMVGVLGWADVSLPLVVTAGWLGVAASLAVAGWWAGGRRARGWLVLLGLGVLVLPVVADLRSGPTIGFVWQGRYTLPLAVGLALLGGQLVDRRPRPDGARAATPLLVVVATALLLGHLVAFAVAAVRFRVGVGGPLGRALTVGGGPVGLPAWVPLLAVVAVGVGTAVTLRKGQCALGGEPVVRR